MGLVYTRSVVYEVKHALPVGAARLVDGDTRRRNQLIKRMVHIHIK